MLPLTPPHEPEMKHETGVSTHNFFPKTENPYYFLPVNQHPVDLHVFF